MPVGLYTLGGARNSCMHCSRENCTLPMSFTVWKTNDLYYNPGDRASWARRSRAGGGQNWGRKNGTRIGVNRLGGKKS